MDKMIIAKSAVNSKKKTMTSKMIYSFSFERKYSLMETISKLCLYSSKRSWIWDKCEDNIYAKDNELYSHIEDLVVKNNYDCPNCIGSTVELTSKGNNNRLERAVSGQLFIKWKDHDEIQIYVCNIQLILFKTNIGFLTLDIEYDTDILDDVIMCNNILKAATKFIYSQKSEKYSRYMEKIIHKQAIEKENISFKPNNNHSEATIRFDSEYEKCYIDNNLFDIKTPTNTIVIKKGNTFELHYESIKNKHISDIVLNLLSDLDGVSFFNSNNIRKKYGFEKAPVKANIFSSIILENGNYDDNMYLKAFYWLKRGYKDTYIPTKKNIDIENNPDVFTTFKYNYWGLSREGLVNLGRHSGEKDSDFYRSGYSNKIRTYYYLYIIVLHQYYGLVKMSREIALLPNSSRKYIGVRGQKKYSDLVELREEINFFYMKSIFQEVSHITHQNTLYKRMHKVLGIIDMMNELSDESSSITNLLTEDRERDKEIRVKNFMVIGGLFAVISAFYNIWSIITYYKINTWVVLGIKLNSIILSILFLIPIILLGFIIGTIYFKRWKRKKRKKQ